MAMRDAETARRMEDVAQRQARFSAMEERLAGEERGIRQKVKSEFQTWDASDPIQQRLHDTSGGIERVYGGQEASTPQEMQLVQAWRPAPDGSWTLGQGVVHRVHDDDTVTVQFVPDQHRCRLPFMSVKPMLDVTPEYPTIRLQPGQRMPTRAEIELREHNANVYRQQQGIAWDAPLPGAMDHNALLAGERLGDDGRTPVIESDQWGISAPTLEALRNRSIPAAQVTGTYGDHFYSKLYKNNFFQDKKVYFHADGRPYIGSAPGVSAQGGASSQTTLDDNAMDDSIVSHRYIPLHGPEMVQDLRTGRWMVQNPSAEGGIEGPGLLG